MLFDTSTKKLTAGTSFLIATVLPMTAAASTPASGEMDYLQLGVTLIFIVGLIFACGWLVRRMAGGAGFNNRHIKVLSVTPLGTREKLMLVRAADEYLLLGVTPNGISTLHRYEEPIELNESAVASPFADRMKGLLKGLDSDPLAKHKKSHSKDDSKTNKGD